ncbi:MAG: phosphate acetyltransferase [Flavobacteriaceae bacterium]|nr:phosphate acetyltransferase [Flavobacteriaceae bacterium]
MKNKAIYIAANEANSGKSIVTLGLMSMLLGKTAKVGYFRPIIDDTDGEDAHINTIIKHFDLKVDYKDTFVFKRSQLIKKLNKGKQDQIINKIIDRYKAIEEENDFVLVEGTDFSGDGTSIEMNANVLIAKNLGIPAIIVASGVGKTLEGFVEGLHLAYDSFKQKDVEVLAVIPNKVQKENIELVKKEVAKDLPKSVLVNVIPTVNTLKNPTVKEIADAIGAEVLFGEKLINNMVEEIKVGAMQLPNFLNHLTENSLTITPGDRADILLATLQANLSVSYPSLAGVILTGGFKPSDSTMKLIEGLQEVIPVVSVKEGTFAVASKVGAVRSHIYADNKEKIAKALSVFDKYIDTEGLSEKLVTFKKNGGITPRMFQYNLLKNAKKERKCIVLPEGNDDRILKAVAQLQQLDVVDMVVLGEKSAIESAVNRLGIDFNFEKITIINPIESEYYEDFTNTLYELRKHKGVSPAMARDLMADVSYFGTMMVHKGLADGMVSGAAHTTQHTILPALQFVKTKPGFSVVSSVFFMCLEDRVSVFGDCAINPNPTAEQLAEIAISSADSSIAFGIDPKVAMLSYSSGTSGKGEDVDIVRRATEIVKEKRPDLKVEGPIQYDAAVDASVGKSKLPNSEVAGQANVLIFPDLNTGNNTYKAVQRETGALAIGPMLQGLNKPVNDLSRGCTVDDILNTVVLTAIQAQQG